MPAAAQPAPQPPQHYAQQPQRYVPPPQPQHHHQPPHQDFANVHIYPPQHVQAAPPQPLAQPSPPGPVARTYDQVRCFHHRALSA